MANLAAKVRTQISTTGKSNNLSRHEWPGWKQSSDGKIPAEAGFTLMELIIVSALAVLFLSLSLPTLRNNLYINELDSTARKIVGTVQALRNTAVREHKAYLLHFDIDENRIWHELDGNIDPFGDEPKPGTILPEGIQIDEIQTHSQGKINLGEMTLWISKQGYMDQTVVNLSDGDDKKISLVFSPFSGSAKVYDEYVEIE